MEIFAERLKDLRQGMKLSQKDLAVKTSLTQSAISKWELGTRQIGIDALRILARFFKVSADYLIGLKDTEN